MTKEKISPEEYHNLLDTLELTRISLEKGSHIVKRQEIDDSLSIEIKDTFSFENTDSGMRVRGKYKLISKNKAKNVALKILAEYDLEYESPNDITDEFFDIFKDVSLPFMVWPFFREYVYSLTSRMYLPPLTLPQIRQ